MRRLIFIIFLLITTFSLFSQQFLWSTKETESAKYVPLNNVIKEVLEFYDQYKFYYDYSGYSKDRFLEYFDFGFDWEWLYEIKELTAFALRSNSGRGSVVLVMCVSKDNVNTVIFSNTLETDFLMTHSSEREKFAKWFRTLFN